VLYIDGLDDLTTTDTLGMLGSFVGLIAIGWLLFTVYVRPGDRPFWPGDEMLSHGYGGPWLDKTVWAYSLAVSGMVPHLIALERSRSMVVWWWVWWCFNLIISVRGLVHHIQRWARHRREHPAELSVEQLRAEGDGLRKLASSRLSDAERREMSDVVYRLDCLKRVSVQQLALGFGIGVLVPFLYELLEALVAAL
jgi:hypothetical protein